MCEERTGDNRHFDHGYDPWHGVDDQEDVDREDDREKDAAADNAAADVEPEGVEEEGSG